MEEKNEVKKLSYEELERAVNELNARCQGLYVDLQRANMTNAFKRLDYLFKVVENKSAFGKEFVETCINEIQEIMLPVEETEEA